VRGGDAERRGVVGTTDVAHLSATAGRPPERGSGGGRRGGRRGRRGGERWSPPSRFARETTRRSLLFFIPPNGGHFVLSH